MSRSETGYDGVDCGRRCVGFFFQAEDGIRDLVRSRGLGDVYKRQAYDAVKMRDNCFREAVEAGITTVMIAPGSANPIGCLLYTSDAADDLPCVAPGGRRIITKKTTQTNNRTFTQ